MFAEETSACLEPTKSFSWTQARGGRCLSDLMGLRGSGLAASPQSGLQCQPSFAPLLPTARLQSQALGFGLVPELLAAFMGQLSKLFVVQHDVSSSPMLDGVRVDLRA